MGKKNVRTFMLAPKAFIKIAERAADLPEEIKEKRPYFKELKEAVGQLTTGDETEDRLYALVGGILLGAFYRNPSDPLNSAYETISGGTFQDDLRQQMNEKTRKVASAFFPKIGRQDLVAKYALR